MAVNNQVSSELKLNAVKEYLADTDSLNKIAEKYRVHRSTFQKWLLNYEMFGVAGLQHRIRNQHYSEELKRQAVESYLSGQLSIEGVCKKYQLRSRTQLEKWILLYNGQKEFHSPGGRQKGARMTMTSSQERKAAVAYCIEHGKDYKRTASSFGCTYQQIYGWVLSAKDGSLERVLALTERATRNQINLKIKNGETASVVAALDTLERKLGAAFSLVFQTITVDNGSEFADVEGLERSCLRRGKKRTTLYYCHPYSSSERDSNEKQNGMTRRHPKGTDFKRVSKKALRETTDWINDYPRKIFGFHTAAELFAAAFLGLPALY